MRVLGRGERKGLFESLISPLPVGERVRVRGRFSKLPLVLNCLFYWGKVRFSTDQERQRRYCAFIEEGISMMEKRFIDESVNRNQLTCNYRFVDEIERRIGVRV